MFPDPRVFLYLGWIGVEVKIGVRVIIDVSLKVESRVLVHSVDFWS